MPILIMALLALIIFGTIGILLTIAVIMEHSPAEHPSKRHLSHSETSEIALLDQSSKEKVHEHALVG
jgi:hypothetical protein